MGPQLTSVQKGDYQAAQLSVSYNSYSANSEPGDYTVPADSVTFSVAFKRRTAKTFLTLFLPQAKKGKYFFSFFIPLLFNSPLCGRLSLG